jgi:4'-phosphopantetheinyl transferase
MLDDEVQVWYARQDLPGAALRRLYGALAPDEKSKAALFRFPLDCRRFIARRGILRSLLSKYARIAPAKVELVSSKQGKLHIAAHQSSRIRFNLSHSRWLAIYAVTFDRDVGVDIERIDRSVAWQDISKAFFTECEQNVISRLPADRQPDAFFEIWTRKESMLKALGMGFQFDPAHINVADDYAPGGVTTLRHDVSLWKLLPLSADGFAAALTAAGTGWSLRQRTHHLEDVA